MITDTYALARLLDGRALGPCVPVDTALVASDSRLIQPGDLFVALRGPRFDGNDFARQALSAGAAAALVAEAGALDPGHPGVEAPDTLAALGRLAGHVRSLSGASSWVGVTGSNGKTTTRGMIAAILRLRGPVHATSGNLNNRIGLPLTICRTPADAWAAVIEMGTSEPGEIADLAAIARPQVGVVTMIGYSHMALLGDQAGIAREKAALFRHLPRDGLAIYPARDSQAALLREAIACESATFALATPADPDPEADLVARDIAVEMDGTWFRVDGIETSLRLLGRHYVMDALAAMLAGKRLGVPIAESAAALARLEPVPGRLSRRAGLSLTVLDDAYNSSPSSLEAAVETLLAMPGVRKAAILGDMLDLGAASHGLHSRLGRSIGRLGLDAVLAVGQESLALAEAAESGHARTKVAHFHTMRALLAGMGAYLRPGDTVLVKGSRGMRMETVVEALLKWKP